MTYAEHNGLMSLPLKNGCDFFLKKNFHRSNSFFLCGYVCVCVWGRGGRGCSTCGVDFKKHCLHTILVKGWGFQAKPTFF